MGGQGGGAEEGRIQAETSNSITISSHHEHTAAASTNPAGSTNAPMSQRRFRERQWPILLVSEESSLRCNQH